jgi:hypothetical protein
MLSEREEQFIAYWEANREKEKKFSRQLYIGLPIGIAFAFGIIASVMGGGWYQRAYMVANAQVSPFIFLLGIVAIIVFVAVFYKKFRWEQHEQQYLELCAKRRRELQKAAQ